MGRTAGVVLVVVAVAAAVVAAFWAVMKASGAEVDICSGSDCTSGWVAVVVFAVVAGVAGSLGVRLVRGDERETRS